MSNYDQYSELLTRSVNHIFEKFLGDNSIEEVYETQSKREDPKVAVEIEGTLSGEVIINLPVPTLNAIAKKFNPTKKKISKSSHQDVAGELANLITGSLANQLQYASYDIRLSPPEYNNDPIDIKALYENINLSFHSHYGGFDIDFYFREED